MMGHAILRIERTNSWFLAMETRNAKPYLVPVTYNMIITGGPII